MTDYSATIRNLSRPLEPIPTGVASDLRPLGGIRCALFDVYGTLFISGSGDVGTILIDNQLAAFEECSRTLPEIASLNPQAAVAAYTEEIRQQQLQLKNSGIEFPEVDIVRVWAKVLDRFAVHCPRDLTERIALEYEVRVNPVWPMPNLQRCLTGLRARDLLLGIVSNAQFFTLELFRAFCGKSTGELGFAADLEFYSYRHRQAKPGTLLFELAADALRARGVQPHQVVYIGNDRRNDIGPASEVGFKTGLFAGDKRSLRIREDDPRIAQVESDLILTDLMQLLDCLEKDQD